MRNKQIKSAEELCEKLECKVKETEAGIQVDVKPKDASKTESFKALVRACRDFCGCY